MVMPVRKDGKKYVVKEINISKMPKAERDASQQEAQLLSSLNHPNIVRCSESFIDGGKLCIVMEWCEAGDLYQLLKRQSGVHLSEDRVLDWFVQLCLALKHIHDRKVLHRDIKSQNVFLAMSGIARLGDFGVSKVLTGTQHMASTTVGTPYYLSPEICENKAYNAKSDVWSLGCLLYEMMTLRHAFEAHTLKLLVFKIVRGMYTPPPATYSAPLRGLVSRMLARSPGLRPSVNEILREPIIRNRIVKFLSESMRAEEFAHTVLHKKRLLSPRPAVNPIHNNNYNNNNKAAARPPPPPPARPDGARYAGALPRRHNSVSKSSSNVDNNAHNKDVAGAAARVLGAERPLQLVFHFAEDEQQKVMERKKEFMQRQAEAQRNKARLYGDELPSHSPSVARTEASSATPQAEAGSYSNDKPQQRNKREEEELDERRRRALFFENRAAAARNRMQAHQSENGPSISPSPPVSPVNEPVRCAPESASDQHDLAEFRRRNFLELRAAAERNKRQVYGDLGRTVQKDVTESKPPLHNVDLNVINNAGNNKDKDNGNDTVSCADEANGNNTDTLTDADADEYSAMLSAMMELVEEAAAYPNPVPESGPDDGEAEPGNIEEGVALAGEESSEEACVWSGKFLLHGSTLHLPNITEKDSLPSRIEALCMYLERELGEAAFHEVYARMEEMREGDDEDAILISAFRTLGADKIGMLSLVHQLIVCQDSLNRSGRSQ
eukprot:jgi/Chlat1/9043/Chrsp94S08308